MYPKVHVTHVPEIPGEIPSEIPIFANIGISDGISPEISDGISPGISGTFVTWNFLYTCYGTSHPITWHKYNQKASSLSTISSFRGFAALDSVLPPHTTRTQGE